MLIIIVVTMVMMMMFDERDALALVLERRFAEPLPAAVFTFFLGFGLGAEADFADKRVKSAAAESGL